MRKSVVYLHHSRDADGDVILYFLDAEQSSEPLSSSPVVSIRRVLAPALDLADHGALCRYAVTTRNSEYEVQMPRDQAAHLARELGCSLT